MSKNQVSSCSQPTLATRSLATPLASACCHTAASPQRGARTIRASQSSVEITRAVTVRGPTSTLTRHGRSSGRLRGRPAGNAERSELYNRMRGVGYPRMPAEGLSPEQLEEKFDLAYHFKAIDTIFARVFGE